MERVFKVFLKNLSGHRFTGMKTPIVWFNDLL